MWWDRPKEWTSRMLSRLERYQLVGATTTSVFKLASWSIVLCSDNRRPRYCYGAGGRLDT
jgi:hypothetical protein